MAAALAVLAGAAGWVHNQRNGSAEYLESQLRAGGATASAPRDYRTLAELLPNVRVQRGDAQVRPADGAILGRVLDVAEGSGFVIDGDDAHDGRAVDFDHGKAIWRTVHLSVAVDEDFGKHSWAGRTVSVGLAMDGDADFSRAKDALPPYGSVVIFLDQRSRVFAYASDVVGVAGSGTMFAVADEDGSLRMPFLDSAEADAMLGHTRSLPALKAESAKPARVITSPA